MRAKVPHRLGVSQREAAALGPLTWGEGLPPHALSLARGAPGLLLR